MCIKPSVHHTCTRCPTQAYTIYWMTPSPNMAAHQMSPYIIPLQDSTDVPDARVKALYSSLYNTSKQQHIECASNAIEGDQHSDAMSEREIEQVSYMLWYYHMSLSYLYGSWVWAKCRTGFLAFTKWSLIRQHGSSCCALPPFAVYLSILICEDQES